MQQLISVWKGLTVQRRVIIVTATAAMFAMVLGIARLATAPDLTLLYSGLETGAAGDVIAALEARGVLYEVRGGAIFVEEASRDQLRMTLASEGLPGDTTQGYELLDQMTGFGTTSQMFDAAYWRAKEGELARTIVASPSIRAARVHIANPATKPFQRDRTASASVTVTPAAGGIGAQQARALRYLVASAVGGLSPENVSVIDSTGGVILSSGEEAGAMANGTSRAATLKRNVERLLEARVGYGRAVVEVNVDTVTESEKILERRIDPDSRVAISQDTSQSQETSKDSGEGDVTVASNLPDGDAAEGQGQSSRSNTETRERVNFEVSEIERQVTRVPGAVARITTAVLIDGIEDTGADGTVTWSPRSEAEMEALRELVSAAVGFDAERGDTLSLRSMQFEPLPAEGSGPITAGFFGPLDTMRLIQVAILALVVIVIALFVIRPIFVRRDENEVPALEGFDGGMPPFQALSGEIDPENMPADLSDVMGGGAERNETAGAVERLRQLIDERQEESLQILKSWMEDEEKA